jgi:phosphodiesterase/alkaline phosphatase D-like protein
MNKNTLLGILIAIIVLGGGYFLLRNKPFPPGTDQVSTTTTTTIPGSVDTTAGEPSQNLTPGAPVAETSSNAGASSSSVIVNGEVKPNGAITTYWFEYGPTNSLGARSPEQNIGSGYAMIPTPTYIVGLKANTQYFYRLNAKNSFASVNGSTYSFRTNNNPPPVAALPTAHTVAASSIARTSGSLNGSVNPNGFSTSYWFEYGMDTGFGSATTLTSAGSDTSTNSVSMAISNLKPLTKYYFRMNAQNQFGTVNGATMNFTTTGPAATANITVSTTAAASITATSAQLTGRIDPKGTDVTYWFEYSNDSLLGTLIGAGTAQQKVAAGTSIIKAEASAFGLRANTNYYYRLVAKNAQGTVRGDIVSFKTTK